MLRLNGALQQLRSFQDTRQEGQEQERIEIHDKLRAANLALGSLSQNESAEQASRRRADQLLELGLEIAAHGWEDWFRATAGSDPLTREFAEMMLNGDPEPLAGCTNLLPTAEADFQRIREWLKRLPEEWSIVHQQGWLRWQFCRDLPATESAAPISNPVAKPDAPENNPLKDRESSVVDRDSTRQTGPQPEQMAHANHSTGLHLPSIAVALRAFRSVVAASPSNCHSPGAHTHASFVAEAKDRLRRLLTPSDPEWRRSNNSDLDDPRLTAKLFMLLKEVWNAVIRDLRLPPPFPADQRDNWDVLLEETESELQHAGIVFARVTAADTARDAGEEPQGDPRAAQGAGQGQGRATTLEPESARKRSDVEGTAPLNAPAKTGGTPRNRQDAAASNDGPQGLQPVCTARAADAGPDLKKPAERGTNPSSRDQTAEESVSDFVACQPQASLQDASSALGLGVNKISRTAAWKAHEERRLADYLDEHCGATAADAERALGISDSKIVGMEA
jgi:hypothetical protein